MLSKVCNHGPNVLENNYVLFFGSGLEAVYILSGNVWVETCCNVTK